MKKKNIRKNVELQSKPLEVILPSIILLIFLVIIFITITNGIGILTNKPEEIDYEALLWEQAYIEAQKNRVGIIFDSILTSREQYEELQQECNKFIQETDNNKDIDATIDVDIPIDEVLYVDNIKEDISDDKSKELNETGPIYFNNLLMVRYINEEGNMKVIAASFNEDNTIEIYRQDTLPVIESVELGIDKSELSPDSILEEDYLNNLGNSLLEMLKANTYDEIHEADIQAIKYFTLEGKQTVFGNKNKLGHLDKDSDIKIKYIEAGKSDIGKGFKDRIYTQLLVDNNQMDDYTINIILKLNSNYRVFDIDII